MLCPKSRYHAEELKLSIGDVTIRSAGHVHNLGAYFDKELKMDKQISEVSKISFYHLRNTGRILIFLTEEACKTLVQVLVISRLDFAISRLVIIIITAPVGAACSSKTDNEKR